MATDEGWTWSRLSREMRGIDKFLRVGSDNIANRGQQVPVLDAAIEIGTRLERKRDAFRGGAGELVRLIDVADGAAIGNHIPLKAPLFAQNVGEQAGVGAGRLAIHAVIC